MKIFKMATSVIVENEQETQSTSYLDRTLTDDTYSQKKINYKSAT